MSIACHPHHRTTSRMEIATCYLWDHRKELGGSGRRLGGGQSRRFVFGDEPEALSVRGEQRFSQGQASLLVEDAGAVGEDMAGRQDCAQVERQRRHHALPKGFLLVSECAARLRHHQSDIGAEAERHGRRASRRCHPHARAAGRGRGDPTDGARRPRARACARSGCRRRRPRDGVGRRRDDQRSGARARAARTMRACPRPALGIIQEARATASRAIWAFRSIPRRRSSTRCARTLSAVDAGEIGDCLFFNVAGIGLDAHVAALVTTRIHHRGLMPYLTRSAGDLLRYRPVEYTIEIDGRTTQTSALVLAFANSKQWGFGRTDCSTARISRTACWISSLVHHRGFVGNMLRVPALFARPYRSERRNRYASRARRHDSVPRSDAVPCRWGSGAGLGHARRARASRGAAAAGVKQRFRRIDASGQSNDLTIQSYQSQLLDVLRAKLISMFRRRSWIRRAGVALLLLATLSARSLALPHADGGTPAAVRSGSPTTRAPTHIGADRRPPPSRDRTLLPLSFPPFVLLRPSISSSNHHDAPRAERLHFAPIDRATAAGVDAGSRPRAARLDTVRSPARAGLRKAVRPMADATYEYAVRTISEGVYMKFSFRCCSSWQRPGSAFAPDRHVLEGRLVNSLSGDPIRCRDRRHRRSETRSRVGPGRHVRFDNLAPGTYHVWVRAQGYSPRAHAKSRCPRRAARQSRSAWIRSFTSRKWRR